MIAAVTRSEANVLTLARVAVGAYPAQDALRLLIAQAEAPVKLGPTARALLSDTLARGAVGGLARGGGWSKQGGRRLWERHEPPPLRFTASLVRLFRWMLMHPLAGSEVPPLTLDARLTLAEQVVVTLLLEKLRGTGCEGTLALQPAVREAPLVVLAHAAMLAQAAELEEVPEVELPASAVVLEGLRDVFARAWVSGERLKRDQEKPAVLARIGRAQTAVLDTFLPAIDQAGQRQLAGFLVDAAVEWLSASRTSDEYVRTLTPDAPLKDRTEARRQAGAFLRRLPRLHAWDREHRSVRFIDDEYRLAQQLVKDWERLGEQGFNEAARLVAELDALPT
ncbi:MAG: hypothetical protein AMXMBFR34_50240 [Myxococcaceae bacterium]